jgi:DNA repair exonuclease SbcCD ATPase subunit
MRSPAAERRVRPSEEEEKLRVIGKRLGREINRLNQLRKDVLDLKQYVQRQSIGMPNKNDLLGKFQEIYALFPDLNNSAHVGFDMENRLSKDIEESLENVRAFLTRFHMPDYPELHEIETKVTEIRDALRELLKENKSTVKEYREAQKKTSEESNGEGNPPAGDSAAPEEAKGGTKPGFWGGVRNWWPFGRGENIKSLLLELKALGDDSPF